MSKFIDYAQHLNASIEVKAWITKRLPETIDTGEGEHIIDYLVAENPKLTSATYEQVKHNTDKWVKMLEKKGEHIKETADDTKVVLDFKDGFKIVQLIGKNAYEREGYLMRHCVASYYGKNTKIYSLRDDNNMPHCTMEQDQQVKGKGNGDIHPKYVGYVVQFLEHIGMTVGESEMRHLGYISAESFMDDLGDKSKKELFNKKYLPKNAKLFDKDGEEFATLSIFNQVPLIEQVDSKLKINFELPPFIKLSVDFLLKKVKQSKTTKATTKDGAHAATAGSRAHAATAGYDAHAATAGDDAHAATAGYRAHAATAGYRAHAATAGDDAHAATAGSYAHAATAGSRANAATAGYGAHAATAGSDAIAAAIGQKASAKGQKGCWLVIAEWQEINGSWKPVSVISKQVDGEVLKEDTWYKNENGEFVEVK